MSSAWIAAMLILSKSRPLRTDSAAYNVVLTTAVPLLLAAVGVLAEQETVITVASIWLNHIAVDRALGYSLKLPIGLRATHPVRL